MDGERIIAIVTIFLPTVILRQLALAVNSRDEMGCVQIVLLATPQERSRKLRECEASPNRLNAILQAHIHCGTEHKLQRDCDEDERIVYCRSDDSSRAEGLHFDIDASRRRSDMSPFDCERHGDATPEDGQPDDSKYPNDYTLIGEDSSDAEEEEE